MTTSPLCLAAGTYAGAGGRGLYALGTNADGTWTVGDACADAPNASFGVCSPRHGLHYIVDECEAGSVGIVRHDANGWRRLARAATGGATPCHVALDPTGTMLAVANYGGGSVALFRLDARDGLFTGVAQVHANRGSGPNAERQDAPHAHWVGFSPDGRWLYQTDLGTDQILAFPIGPQRTLGAARVAFVAPAGSGPRHMVLHPTLPARAYLASELASTLTVLDRSEGSFCARRTVSTLPEGWQGHSIVAHIAANRAGDRLYVSNRGHDSIAVFALDARGEPTLVQHVAAGGASPRFFLLLDDRRMMIVANEQAQTVTTLAIGDDGLLTRTGVSLAIPGVAFVMVASAAASAR